MPTPSKGPRLGGGPAHERLMLANLATQLFTYGKITTTETKAKRLRPYAERLITFGKRGDLHARRQVMKVIRDKTAVHVLFTEIGPAYAGRPGGYTRIIKLGPRKGDNAPMAQISLVEAMTEAKKVVAEAEAARGTTFTEGSAPTGATAEAAAELAAENETAAAVAAAAADQPAVDEAAADGVAAADVAEADVAGADNEGTTDEVVVDVPDEAVEEVPADPGHSVAEDPDAVVPADEATTDEGDKA